MDEPKSIVQIVHGFGEHSRRYLHLIDKLTETGYAVSADGHLGHGQTAADNDSWGYPGTKGVKSFVNDEQKLHDIAKQDYPGLPYFMFAHSWGSVIARGYAADYGEGVVADYAADPLNGMNVNLRFIYDFIQGFEYIDNAEWADKVCFHSLYTGVKQEIFPPGPL